MRRACLFACLFSFACSSSHHGADGGVPDGAAPADASLTGDLRLPGYPAMPSQTIAAPADNMENYAIVIAVSADGSTIAACGGKNSVASVLIYTRTGTSYSAMPTQTLLTPENVESFCSQVGLSADGTTLTVGGVDGTSLNSAVAVYTRSGGMYPMVPTQVIVTSDNGLPWSAAISADGNTLATSSNVADGVFVYTRTGAGAMFPATPTQTLAKPSTGDALFGSAVTLDGDGSKLLAANESVSGSVGRLYAYTRTSGMYGAPTEVEGPSTTSTSFANALSLRADGLELAEGGNPPVHIAIYAPSGDTYLPVGNVSPPAGSPSNFAPSLALAADGTLIVGSFETNAILVYPPN
jgi:hypothetical protein